MLGVIDLELGNRARCRLELGRILDTHLCKTVVFLNLGDLCGRCDTPYLGCTTQSSICRDLRTQRRCQDISRCRASRPRLLLGNILESICRTGGRRRDCNCILGSTQRSLGIHNPDCMVFDTRDRIYKVGLGKRVRAARTNCFGGVNRRINLTQVQPSLLAIHIAVLIHNQ